MPDLSTEITTLRRLLNAQQIATMTAVRKAERLEAELAAALKDAEDMYTEAEHYANLAIVDLGANPTVSWMERAKAAEAERDALRELLVELREWFTPYNKEILARIDAALNKGGTDD